MPKSSARGKGDNLVGKITNLITSDLANINAGRGFLIPLVSSPIIFLLGAAFLYKILDWRCVILTIAMSASALTRFRCASALVGLAIMIALTPVPAWGASLVSGVQKKVSLTYMVSIRPAPTPQSLPAENGSSES